MALIEELGAKGINYQTEAVADYVAKHTGGVGFDVVYDSVGGENPANSFEAAKLNGQVAATVSLVKLDLSVAHFKGLSLHVVFMLIPMLYNHGREEHGRILGEIAKIVEAGGLQPVLDEIGKAHTRLSSGDAIGKIVVEIQE